MVFGQAPPPIAEDKVYFQPCFVRQVRGCILFNHEVLNAIW